MITELRILALETSSRHGSIALLKSAQVSAECQLPASTGTAQSLVPAIEDILRSLDWSPHDTRVVAVTNGPGSFTGLRVGVTTAKTFAYATGADIVAVNTLDCIAAQAPHEATRIHVVIDAQRGDFYAASYARRENGDLQLVSQPGIVACRAWLIALNSGDTVIGPGLVKLKEPLPDGVGLASEHLWNPTAATVGRLAYAKYQLGQRDDLWTLAPVYYRKSSAEEKLAKRL